MIYIVQKQDSWGDWVEVFRGRGIDKTSAQRFESSLKSKRTKTRMVEVRD